MRVCECEYVCVCEREWHVVSSYVCVCVCVCVVYFNIHMQIPEQGIPWDSSFGCSKVTSVGFRFVFVVVFFEVRFQIFAKDFYILYNSSGEIYIINVWYIYGSPRELSNLFISDYEKCKKYIWILNFEFEYALTENFEFRFSEWTQFWVKIWKRVSGLIRYLSFVFESKSLSITFGFRLVVGLLVWLGLVFGFFWQRKFFFRNFGLVFDEHIYNFFFVCKISIIFVTEKQMICLYI